MKRSSLVLHARSGRYGGRRARAAVLTLAAAALCCFAGAAPASANFEFVKTFANGATSEGGPITGSPLLAVSEHNGDVYEADEAESKVLRFGPHGEFLEAWGWGVGDGKKEFERCGPQGEAAFPQCPGRASENEEGKGWSGEGPGQFKNALAIAVSPASGDVYVASGHEVGDVQVFSESGELITSFANQGSGESEYVEAGPITVDGSGDVYFSSKQGTLGPRILEFVKKSNTEYTFTRALLSGQTEVSFLNVGTNGSLFVATFGQIFRFDPPNFTTAAWEHSLSGASAVTINPQDGTVFYYNYGANQFHEFKPRGKNEVESLAGEAGREELFEGQQHEENASSAAYEPAGEETGHGRGIFYAGVERNNSTREKPHLVLFAPSPVFPPTVTSESVSRVGATTVELGARIESKNYDTHYRFQYGSEDCATHACSELPLGGADLGASPEALGASVALSGLQPETTYHYRVIATNAYGTAEGADETFTTYPVLSDATLADGRVYELVSPPFKDGGEVFPVHHAGSCSECTPGEITDAMAKQSSADGSAVVYQGDPFAKAGEATASDEYLSRRGATGWQTEGLSPQGAEGTGFRVFSADLSSGVFAEFPGQKLTSDALSVEGEGLYARQGGGSLQALMTTSDSIVDECSHARDVVAGGSLDLSHVAFEAGCALTGATPYSPQAPAVDGGREISIGRDLLEPEYDLYDWSAGGMSLVNVLPGNTAALPGAVLGSGRELAVTGESGSDFSHAVSDDGSRIFWSNTATGQVYVREDGERTVEIPDAGRFLTASADGSRVLLADGKLYDLESHALTDLTGGKGGFAGILGANEDLSKIYFVDTEKLTGGQENDHGTVAQASSDNVYVYDTTTGTVWFVATLETSDGQTGVNNMLGAWNADPGNRTAQVSPDGRYLAFMSQAPLTGYDNRAAVTECPSYLQIDRPGPVCFEVFEYDNASRSLVCASCNPTGAAPLGGSSLSLIDPLQSSFPQPRNLTENGRVFFDSRDTLSLLDTNGTVEDVYEYEPGGVGSCTRPRGCIYLISSGYGSSDSNFFGASASGNDVFFTTRDALVPEDQDDLVDLYDARVNGGFAAVTAPACTGTGCQGVPGAPPIFATPSSVTFAGVGNYESAAASGASAKGSGKKRKKTVGGCAKRKPRGRKSCGKTKGRSGRAHRAARGRSGDAALGGRVRRGERG